MNDSGPRERSRPMRWSKTARISSAWSKKSGTTERRRTGELVGVGSTRVTGRGIVDAGSCGCAEPVRSAPTVRARHVGTPVGAEQAAEGERQEPDRVGGPPVPAGELYCDQQSGGQCDHLEGRLAARDDTHRDSERPHGDLAYGLQPVQLGERPPEQHAAAALL